MKDRDTAYLIAMLITGIVLAGSIVYIALTTGTLTPTQEDRTEEGGGRVMIPEFKEIPEQSIDCKICHLKPEKIPEHMNGGAYCAACHGSDVHGLHTSDKTVNLSCRYCHNPTTYIPKRLPGDETVCDACHDPKDPLKPSYGGIIEIHIYRGYTCDLCHVEDIQSLHQDLILGSNETLQ
ncbi:hypothetical protein DRN85_07920 [Methanosarcinales archaeon]|nr:MAG: hypothetical protein DRN85_07920 [Methanosarcinales archaeon]